MGESDWRKIIGPEAECRRVMSGVSFYLQNEALMKSLTRDFRWRDMESWGMMSLMYVGERWCGDLGVVVLGSVLYARVCDKIL